MGGVPPGPALVTVFTSGIPSVSRVVRVECPPPTVTGSPAEFEQLRNDGTTSRGRAPTIDYETANGTVSFRDRAWLSDGCNEITGNQLVYNIKAQSVQGQTADTSTPGANGRVRIVIQPQSQQGKPCNATGSKP